LDIPELLKVFGSESSNVVTRGGAPDGSRAQPIRGSAALFTFAALRPRLGKVGRRGLFYN
jgi:hypothetical protein